MVPLNMDSEQALTLSGVFGCKLRHVLHLSGLSNGITKPRVEHFTPLINRVERQLTIISSMLTKLANYNL
jgi:hypothetical protein